MAIVNPPPHLVIPRAFFEEAEQREYFTQLEFIIFQLWARSGGGEDLLDSTEQALTSINSRVSRNTAKINALEKTTFDIETVTADFTTSGRQILICRNTVPVDITLDTLAVEEDHLHIKRRGVRINIIGTVDGILNPVINIPNFSLELVFDGVDWSQI